MFRKNGTKIGKLHKILPSHNDLNHLEQAEQSSNLQDLDTVANYLIQNFSVNIYLVFELTHGMSKPK